jgi:hypothetical protein
MTNNKPFNQALREVIGRRAPDREKWFRKFVAWKRRWEVCLERGATSIEDILEPGDAEVAAIIAHYRKNGFDREAFNELKLSFKKFEPSIKRSRAVKAINARWIKARAQKNACTAKANPKKSTKYPRSLR